MLRSGDVAEASQANKPFREPPRWTVRWITRAQVFVYEHSNGRIGASAAGMRHLLLRATGRRSGRSSTVCLPYWLDPENRRIVVASYGGAPRNPAWFHNVADRGANPEVVVRDRDRVFWSIAEVLKGSERDELWAHLVADRPFYADYQTRTERTIPLVRLVELRPYEP